MTEFLVNTAAYGEFIKRRTFRASKNVFNMLASTISNLLNWHDSTDTHSRPQSPRWSWPSPTCPSDRELMISAWPLTLLVWGSPVLTRVVSQHLMSHTTSSQLGKRHRVFYYSSFLFLYFLSPNIGCRGGRYFYPIGIISCKRHVIAIFFNLCNVYKSFLLWIAFDQELIVSGNWWSLLVLLFCCLLVSLSDH